MTIEIANRLCAYRKYHDLSQEELAEKIGVSRQAVSKWERAEASPDTDNLILLAKTYGVTLDDLLHTDPGSQPAADDPTAFDEHADEDEYTDGNGDEAHVSFKNGIHIHSKDGDHVDIDWSGVHVQSHDGEKVRVSFDGIHVEEDGHVHVYTDEKGIHVEDENAPSPALRRFRKIWNRFPYPVLCVLAYLVFGFCNVCGGWAVGAIIFVTIPIYYSIGDAIAKKDPHAFCYPVLVTVVYLYLGFFYMLWHPMWLLFITIPIYYFLCDLITSLVKKNREPKEEPDSTIYME